MKIAVPFLFDGRDVGTQLPDDELDRLGPLGLECRVVPANVGHSFRAFQFDHFVNRGMNDPGGVRARGRFGSNAPGVRVRPCLDRPALLARRNSGGGSLGCRSQRLRCAKTCRPLDLYGFLRGKERK